MFFLHSKGYNLFNMNRLTYAEVEFITEAHNRDVERQNNELKKAKSKRK